MQKKSFTFELHRTQKDRDYLEWEAMLNLASYRGSQSCSRYAEAFESVRFLVNNLLYF